MQMFVLIRVSVQVSMWMWCVVVCCHLQAGFSDVRVRSPKPFGLKPFSAQNPSSLFISFTSAVRRIFMVRKGWSTVEVPNGWLQIIRGPKPVSVLGIVDLSPAAWLLALNLATQLGHGWPFPKASSETDTGVESHCRSRQDCLPTGVHRSSGSRGPEEALSKAELQAKAPPLETQIAHAVQFIESAKKRVAEADEKIRKAAEAVRQAEAEKVADIQAIAEAEAQVERLRVQSVQPVAQPTVVHAEPWATVDHAQSCAWRVECLDGRPARRFACGNECPEHQSAYF